MTDLTFGQSSADWANALGAIFCSLLFVVVILAFFVVLFYRVFQRAGYNGWLGLLSLIPGIGSLICLCILAFDTWPAKKESDNAVRCLLPGYGAGTFVPDPPQPPVAPAAAPAPAPQQQPPAPPAPMAPPAPPAPAAPVPQPPAPAPAAPMTPAPEVPVPAVPAAPQQPPVPAAPPAEEGQTL